MDISKIYLAVDDVLSHFIDEDSKVVYLNKYDIDDFKEMLVHSLSEVLDEE